jgi:hypothetical protein
MVGHRVMGISLLLTGGMLEGRGHLDQALALYDPAEHHPLATRFGADPGVSMWSYRSIALWLLGYSDAAPTGACGLERAARPRRLGRVHRAADIAGHHCEDRVRRARQSRRHARPEKAVFPRLAAAVGRSAAPRPAPGCPPGLPGRRLVRRRRIDGPCAGKRRCLTCSNLPRPRA